MDDGDLGDSIDQEAAVVEAAFPRQKRFQNDNAHLDPSRWWFASSAFPMIAGTLGPVASTFSICALVRPWRQQLVAGATLDAAPFIADPPWLTIINAIQLVVAIVSNIFLLLNMARRVRFSLAQPVTIVGWYISAIILIALASTASGPLLKGLNFPVEEIMWSQAFYYGIWAAILYFVDASFMVITFYGATKGKYAKDFMLTPSQRTLMLQTIMFMMYLLIGALIFSNMEHWNYLDGVYWAAVTLFTVGFGDYVVESTLGRALLMPYALVGIISLGLVIGSIRSLVLERGRRRMAARVEEKKRRKMVKRMTAKGNDDILEPIRVDSPSFRSENVPANEYERRKAEFSLMRKIQDQAATRRKWIAMGIATGSWLILWLAGALVFLSCEKPYQDWKYFDAFYLCFVSLTTVGYGDLTPISNGGKSFFVFWCLLALPTMTVLISNAGDTIVKFIRDATLHLGTITILPDEQGFSRNMRHIIWRLTLGNAFASHQVAPGSQAPSVSQTENPTEPESSPDQEGRGRSNHPGGVKQRRQTLDGTESTFTSHVRRSLSRLRDPLDDLPMGVDLHFLLISEIQVVAGHLKGSKPHRYSFEQWAWYLRLIGEDERSAETHRKALPRAKHRNKPKCNDNTLADEDTELSWSWVGHRSPLMGSQEESEWILDRLMGRLSDLISAESKRRRQRKAQETHKGAEEVYNLHRSYGND